MLIFDSAELATAVARRLDTDTLDNSGWHVYRNMEHVGGHLLSVGQPWGKDAYPRTNSLLSRSVCLTVGVVCPGMGAAFGININSSEEEIKTVAEKLRRVCVEANASRTG